VDVCRHLTAVHGVPVQLVAVLSARDFEMQRDKLLKRVPGAIAIRSPFGWRAWPLARRVSATMVARALPSGTRAILARGPTAALIALDLKRRGHITRVGYDGRGAVAAEWSEYDVAPSETWKNRMAGIESDVVLGADMRLAVSAALVDYWRERYGYSGDRHVVIPRTLSAHHGSPASGADAIARRRAELGIGPQQTVICYAGSEAEWQSISKLDPWLEAILARNPGVALLMMTRADLSETRVRSNHPDRVHQTWVSPDKVRETMEIADYGLLVRDRSVTNRVAAPTKFAEYLAAGLRILISPEVGDYSQMVASQDLGLVCDLASPAPVLAPPESDRARLRVAEFAKKTFTKAAHDDSYATLLAALDPDRA
jgi:hypothetical protein